MVHAALAALRADLRTAQLEADTALAGGAIEALDGDPLRPDLATLLLEVMR